MQFFLLNAIEGFMCVYICVNLNKNVTVSKFVLAWFLCTLTIYVYPIIIGIPIFVQLVSCIVNAFIISSIFGLKYKECVKRIFILYFIILLLIDMLGYFISVNLFSFNPVKEEDIFSIVKYSSPVRLIE
jgi:hypothetical protein